ncbi:hypothetical protein BH11ARM2_BH11ARM2_32510 [soil metagenome]
MRARYWKNQAALKGLEYDVENRARMRRGRAPETEFEGRMVSKELHHNPAQRDRGLLDFIEVWPHEHAAIDPRRRTGKP